MMWILTRQKHTKLRIILQPNLAYGLFFKKGLFFLYQNSFNQGSVYVC